MDLSGKSEVLGMSSTNHETTAAQFLAWVKSIRRAPGQEGDYAPHKPLMLLLALARAQQGCDRLARFEEIESHLKSLLAEFAKSGAVQTRHLPFWRLKNDHDGRIWQVEDTTRAINVAATDPPSLTILRASDVAAGFPPDVAAALAHDPDLIVEAARVILDSTFPKTLHEDIAQAVGLDLRLSATSQRVSDVEEPYAVTEPRRRRDPGFRDAVLRAYEYRCCVCGFDLRVSHIPVGLEAAHIQWHTVGGPDEVPNGLALCALHHKLFDLGAFTVEPNELRVLFSEHAISGARGLGEEMRHHGQRMHPPQRSDLKPGQSYLAWNLRNVFKAPARGITTNA